MGSFRASSAVVAALIVVLGASASHGADGGKAVKPLVLASGDGAGGGIGDPSCVGPIEGILRCGEAGQGTLAPGDTVLQATNGFVDAWMLELDEATVVTIRMTSGPVDTLLGVADFDCLILDVNDDWQGSLDESRTTTLLPAGEHLVVASTFANNSGDYELTVTSCEPAPPCDESCEDLGPIECDDVILTELAPGDCELPGRGWARYATLSLEVPQSVSIDLTATGAGDTQVDTHLLVTDLDCRPIALNDDCGNTTNSCLSQVLLPAGDYRIWITSWRPFDMGPVLLRVRCEGPPPVPVPALSEWAFAVLALAVATLGFFVLRRRRLAALGRT